MTKKQTKQFKSELGKLQKKFYRLVRALDNLTDKTYAALNDVSEEIYITTHQLDKFILPEPKSE